MKPHEQEWGHNSSRLHGGYVYNAATRDDVAHVNRDYEDARPLIAAAPDMARALLSELDPDGHVIACGNGGDSPDDCSPRCRKVTAALRKAGVL